MCLDPLWQAFKSALIAIICIKSMSAPISEPFVFPLFSLLFNFGFISSLGKHFHPEERRCKKAHHYGHLLSFLLFQPAMGTGKVGESSEDIIPMDTQGFLSVDIIFVKGIRRFASD